ncbi:Uncharacterised protein [Mycobacteroides abscessus subsp. massiliense]|nr:Uncharacterised protein [Mycobacteroides abscessus subsp. abscessus]SKO07816.1 Uncharacterised protein [Mycobacteroides abscessus subsp. massiliense]SKQ03124.1 Uncharacterised protein [Mycobacteroides abscessus subsp. massiliense]SKW92349.1 Uncharacterised protein [Mycobacteroides abscessus subsp. massiliense]
MFTEVGRDLSERGQKQVGPRLGCVVETLEYPRKALQDRAPLLQLLTGLSEEASQFLLAGSAIEECGELAGSPLQPCQEAATAAGGLGDGGQRLAHVEQGVAEVGHAGDAVVDPLVEVAAIVCCGDESVESFCGLADSVGESGQ